jgi:hypothetical protein
MHFSPLFFRVPSVSATREVPSVQSATLFESLHLLESKVSWFCFRLFGRSSSETDLQEYKANDNLSRNEQFSGRRIGSRRRQHFRTSPSSSSPSHYNFAQLHPLSPTLLHKMTNANDLKEGDKVSYVSLHLPSPTFDAPPSRLSDLVD